MIGATAALTALLTVSPVSQTPLFSLERILTLPRPCGLVVALRHLWTKQNPSRASRTSGLSSPRRRRGLWWRLLHARRSHRLLWVGLPRPNGRPRACPPPLSYRRRRMRRFLLQLVLCPLRPHTGIKGTRTGGKEHDAHPYEGLIPRIHLQLRVRLAVLS